MVVESVVANELPPSIQATQHATIVLRSLSLAGEKMKSNRGTSSTIFAFGIEIV